MKMMRTLLVALTAAILLLLPARATTTGPSGSFIVGEVDGDDFNYLLEVREGAGTLRGRRAEDSFRPISFTVTSSDGGLHTLRLEADGPGIPPGRAWLYLRTPDEGLLWTPKDDSLLLVRRRIAMPPSLLGDWNAGRSDGSPARVNVAGDRVTFTSEGKVESYAAWPLASQGHPIELVLAMDGEEGRIHYFQVLPDGSMLTWRAEGSAYRVLYRGNRPPAWIAPEKTH